MLTESAMQSRFKTIDHRMESFVALFGRLSPDAHRLQDVECTRHDAMWIRRVLGKGIAGNYVIGYGLDDDWWTFCFDRQMTHAEGGDDADEVWLIEAYDSAGNSWSDIFNYVPSVGRWYRPQDTRQKDESRSNGATSAVTESSHLSN